MAPVGNMPRLSAVKIKNHSGYRVRSEKEIPPLRDGYYQIIEKSMGGEAPKDFVRVYEYGEAMKSDIDRWPAYIAKVGHKWYPNESITEHLITRVGQCFGFNMAGSRLMRADRQIRFLSRYFLNDDERLVHGTEIFGGYLEDQSFVTEVRKKRMSRDVFTFKFILDALDNVFPECSEALQCDYVRMLAFDAIVGNNDRHHANWGVVVHVRGHNPPRFSPIFDSARGIFWNHPERTIRRNTDQEQKRSEFIREYIDGATPLTSWHGRKELNHFQLLNLIVTKYPEYRPVLEDHYRPQALESVAAVLDSEFKCLMSSMRRGLIFDCLAGRLERYKKSITG